MPNFDISLVKNETLIRDDLINFFKLENIDFVDALPALKRKTQDGEVIYPYNDGHPNSAGYLVIANDIYSSGLQ